MCHSNTNFYYFYKLENLSKLKLIKCKVNLSSKLNR